MDYLLHHFRRISDMDMGDSSKGGWGMTHLFGEGGILGPGAKAADYVANAERERKAGMSKFKVGDKVRRVKHTTGLFPKCPIGFETVVLVKYSPEADGFWYEDNCGCIARTGALDDWELIEPAHQGPVRTVTTSSKVIEPGVYGRVKVGIVYGRGQRVAIGINFVGRGDVAETDNAALSPAELRAAAETFTQLADALENSE